MGVGVGWGEGERTKGTVDTTSKLHAASGGVGPWSGVWDEDGITGHASSRTGNAPV